MGGGEKRIPWHMYPNPDCVCGGGEKKLVCAKNVITLKASTFFSAFPLKEELGREGRKRNPLDHKSKEKKEGWGGRTFLAVTLTCQRANPIFIVFRPSPFLPPPSCRSVNKNYSKFFLVQESTQKVPVPTSTAAAAATAPARG